MLFNSLEYLLFLPLVAAIAFALPPKARTFHLLFASYAFYMAWQPAYALLLLASTAVDWLVALGMSRSSAPRRKALMGLSLTVNLGLLGSFKYYDLINSTFQSLAAAAGVQWSAPESSLLLPVGISFYTFQTLGYVIDVYRGKQEPERNFWLFALYVSYFPQLVAGPIERASRLLPQLRAAPTFDYDRAVSGLRLIVWGLFKKCVVADRLAPIVDTVYAEPDRFSGFAVVMATAMFGYQVYCDFSGYSDIAIGSARVMGVRLMRNFDQPHVARSIREFWSRWHISLITWFRDYVYFPLGGSRRGTVRTVFNVLVVFVISGLWHGADWTFAIWGLLCGALILLEQLTAAPRAWLHRVTGLIHLPWLRNPWMTFWALAPTYATFVFFRADNLDHALSVYARIPQGWDRFGDPQAFTWLTMNLDLDPVLLLGALLLIPLTELLELAQRHRDRWAHLPRPVLWATDYVLLFGLISLGRFTSEQFVYFQF